jgi:Novel STAND NTPase 1
MTLLRTSIPSLTSTFFPFSIKQAFSGELIEVCGPDAVDVVGGFRAGGFVTSRANPVDIRHECILRGWPRLGEWLEREARNARRLGELAQAEEDAGGR